MRNIIGPIGLPEILILLVIVLLVFGPRRLPEMAKGLGQSVREFRKGLRDMRKDIEEEESVKAPPVSAASQPPAPQGNHANGESA
jgi:sec-independent protein translocase protein TatA